MTTYVPYHQYAKFSLSLGSKLINLASDTLKCALLSSYTVGSTLSTAQFVADVIKSGVGIEFPTANGYTAGGLALTGLTWQTLTASSWPIAAATTNTQRVGDIVRVSGYLYQCVVAGTTGGTAPSWGTIIGGNTVDGTVTWLNIGSAVSVLTHADLVWTITGAGIAPVAALFYDSTPGTAATNPVIGYSDLSTSSLSASGGGNLDIIHSPSGLMAIPSS